ncbi:MAG: type II secretion system secretin GspD [Aestuariibacter sp.]
MLITLLISCSATNDAVHTDTGQIGNKRLEAGEIHLSSTNASEDSISFNLSDSNAKNPSGMLRQNKEGLEREVLVGSGWFINPELAGNRKVSVNQQGEVTLNFQQVEIRQVLQTIIGEILKENYVVDPAVQGQITFSTVKAITQEQVTVVLESLLNSLNAAMVFIDGHYRILPAVQASKGYLVPSLEQSAQRGNEIRIVPLSFIPPSEMQKILMPIAKSGAIVHIDDQRNIMMLTGTSHELNNYVHTISIFDVDWLAGMSVGIFPVEIAEASTISTELEKVFSNNGQAPVSGLLRFTPIERLNAIMVVSPQQEYLSKVEDWIQRLDRQTGESGTQIDSRLYIYTVKNVKAVSLANTLNSMFSGVNSSNITSGNNRNRSIGQIAPALASTTLSSGNKSNQSHVTNLSKPGLSHHDNAIRINAVDENNALLIQATPTQYRMLLSAINRLDVMPLQVLVEVQIMEVSLNDSLSHGVQWFFESAVNSLNANFDDNGSVRTGSGLFDVDDQLGTLTESGLKYVYANLNAGAIVQMLENYTELNILSSPSLLVLNNKAATINVGDQIPVITTSINPTAGQQQQINQVQFRDTGITLNVTPRVNPGGLVFMEVAQELSEPGADVDGQGNVPISRRSLNTEIAVQSGQTIILGGLISETKRQSSSGLPVLSKIPVLGGLFGSNKNDSNRKELVMLITPTVIDTGDEARKVSNEYKRKLKGLFPTTHNQTKSEG